MDTGKRGTTTEMQVTSIRLEPELKERLRQLSGERGYQSLIRDVLWQFVEQQPLTNRVRSRSSEISGFNNTTLFPSLSLSDIRATFRAIAQQEERCVITGEIIHPHQAMWLGLTSTGELVPLSEAC